MRIPLLFPLALPLALPLVLPLALPIAECHLPAPAPVAEPPAWLLLAAAAVLVGVGRLATR